MEPSFWSWEKMWKLVKEDLGLSGRNGAQLLELGKVHHCSNIRTRNHRRNGAQLLELGKDLHLLLVRPHKTEVAMEPSFWSWEKSSRFFHQLTTSVAHLCEQRKFWGR